MRRKRAINHKDLRELRRLLSEVWLQKRRIRKKIKASPAIVKVMLQLAKPKKTETINNIAHKILALGSMRCRNEL